MDIPQHTLNSSPSDSKKVYTFKNPYPQHFSIVYDIIEYMIKNPSSGKVWKKLIKTCKFFYFKNPVLPVGALDVICDMKCRADGECFDTTLSFPNLWIFDSLKANNDSVQTIIYDCVQLIVPKILKFELRILNVKAQELTWSDYQKLTSSGTIKEINLRDCRICNSEGRIEKLFENLPNLEVIEL
uniref:Uncharacterized protein n=1 Tax=Panagrolaimus superbus TaxID=310955 RepID=A0A914YBT7_9BILA